MHKATFCYFGAKHNSSPIKVLAKPSLWKMMTDQILSNALLFFERNAKQEKLMPLASFSG
jgi:hypothetical protein